MRFWRNASAVPSLCAALTQVDMVGVLAALSRMQLHRWACMQSDMARLVSNVCVAAPQLASRLVQELTATLDQPAILQALFLAHEDYCVLTLEAGSGMLEHSAKWNVPREWLDCSLAALAAQDVAIRVPTHLSLAEIAVVLFGKLPAKIEQNVRPQVGAVSIDGTELAVAQSISFVNTEAKESVDGKLWDVSPSEILIRHENNTVTCLSLAQLRNGQFLFIGGGSDRSAVARSICCEQIGTVCLLQLEGTEDYHSLSIVCQATPAIGLPPPL